MDREDLRAIAMVLLLSLLIAWSVAVGAALAGLAVRLYGMVAS